MFLHVSIFGEVSCHPILNCVSKTWLGVAIFLKTSMNDHRTRLIQITRKKEKGGGQFNGMK